MNNQPPTLTTDQIQLIDLNKIYELDNFQIQPLLSTTGQLSHITPLQTNFNLDPSGYTFNNKEFVNTWPSWNKIKDMTIKYPALKKALENLSTIYTMVKDDYDNPTPKK
jgi:hypothetical protein